jgi:hypothetical protein
VCSDKVGGLLLASGSALSSENHEQADAAEIGSTL